MIPSVYSRKPAKTQLLAVAESQVRKSVRRNSHSPTFRRHRRDKRCGAALHLDLCTRSFIDTNNINHNHPPDKCTMKQKILDKKIDDRIVAEPIAVLKVIERIYAEAHLTDEEQLNIR